MDGRKFDKNASAVLNFGLRMMRRDPAAAATHSTRLRHRHDVRCWKGLRVTCRTLELLPYFAAQRPV
jgi:hypothetical protein